MEYVTARAFADAAAAAKVALPSRPNKPNAWHYSGTGYYVNAANGIRVEFQNTRGGVFGIGYTNNPRQVEAVYAALKATPPLGGKLSFIGKLKGSFNYRATNLDDFFALVEAVGKVKVPFTGRGAGDAVVTAEVPVETAKPALPAPAKPALPAKAKSA